MKDICDNGKHCARVINNATVKLPCTMNSIQEIFSSFAGAKYYSSVDVRWVT